MVVFSKLPLKVHYFLADVFTWFIKRIMKYRADVILVNLAKSFPDLKYWDLRKICNDYYEHLGEIIAEAIWFSGSSYSRLRKSGIVKVVNPEVVSEAYDNSPSVTVLSTHCGNWEILGGLLGYETLSGEKFSFGEKDITVVYKKLKNNISDRVFALNRVQSRSGAYCRSNPPSTIARQSPIEGFSGMAVATLPRFPQRHTRGLEKPAQVSLG